MNVQRFDLNDIEHEPSDEQLASLISEGRSWRGRPRWRNLERAICSNREEAESCPS